ncbi:deoxyribose-phosphate aldolase [Ureibacillus manganicus]|uniref:Deoxyribose-phosphate aldolase n=1 Tax=Ureibacillus manganicus DSM 26584 TaxID=1384049 RepID=A0A0A3IUN1_9BACL|nr:deoxyribose-phosphate aldolase [Ureibacillus manganicus]KGR78542.1 deoxyribose-phosphate aldolase [Ureibacillus manganicus DSM 26584]
MTQNYASFIDHTLLKADSTQTQIEKLCEEALQYKFASVCVNPTWVKLCAEKLGGSEVEVCTVIGFPLGATTSEVKAFETKDAIQKGATEIDMVINIGALKDRQYDVVREDIKQVVAAANGTLVKVIIETCLLTDEEKVKACELSVEAGADFVKTSTGFSTGGATAEDVALMRKTVGPSVGVKASGGVRNLEDMKKMIESGATRIGASSGVAIMNGLSSNSNY